MKKIMLMLILLMITSGCGTMKIEDEQFSSSVLHSSKTELVSIDKFRIYGDKVTDGLYSE